MAVTNESMAPWSSSADAVDGTATDEDDDEGAETGLVGTDNGGEIKATGSSVACPCKGRAVWRRGH